MPRRVVHDLPRLRLGRPNGGATRTAFVDSSRAVVLVVQLLAGIWREVAVLDDIEVLRSRRCYVCFGDALVALATGGVS